MTIAGIHITVEHHPTLGGTPARITIVVPRKKAIVKLANDCVKDMDEDTIIYVILHELGHAVLNTGDEIKVDRWAFRQYAKMNKPLDKAVFSLSKVLNPLNNNEHSERVTRQFYRSKHKNFLRYGTSWNRFIKQKHN